MSHADFIVATLFLCLITIPVATGCWALAYLFPGMRPVCRAILGIVGALASLLLLIAIIWGFLLWPSR